MNSKMKMDLPGLPYYMRFYRRLDIERDATNILVEEEAPFKEQGA